MSDITSESASGPAWGLTEAKIALVSVIVSAIGVLFSAFATFAAWQQLKMQNNEHLTPYRTAIYAARLDAFREMSAATAQLIALNQSMTQQVENSQAGWQKPLSVREQDQVMGENARAFDVFNATFQKGVPLWPETTRKKLTASVEAASTLSFCNAGWIVANGRKTLDSAMKDTGCAVDQSEQTRSVADILQGGLLAMSDQVQQEKLVLE